MNDFAVVNGIYGNFFGNHKPARSAVEVARLPKDVLVEVEAIARWDFDADSVLSMATNDFFDEFTSDIVDTSLTWSSWC